MSIDDAAPAAGEVAPASQEVPGDTAVKPEAPAPSEKPGDKPADKPEDGYQKRINKLTWQRSEARRENAALRQRNQELEAQFQKPKETADEPKESDFQSYGEYLKALSRYETDQRLKAKQKESDDKASRESVDVYKAEVTEQFQERIEEFRESTEDFDDAIKQSGILKLPDSPTVEAMSLAIAESESGPRLLYHLAKNMQEAYRIAHLSPYAAAREIGKLEAKLPELVKPTSSAPAPIAPVKPRAQASESPSESDDMKTWISKRNKQVRRR